MGKLLPTQNYYVENLNRVKVNGARKKLEFLSFRTQHRKCYIKIPVIYAYVFEVFWRPVRSIFTQLFGAIWKNELTLIW